MGQVLHGCATTTEAIRRAIQNSQESLRKLSKRHGIDPKTVAKWRARTAGARPAVRQSPRFVYRAPLAILWQQPRVPSTAPSRREEKTQCLPSSAASISLRLEAASRASNIFGVAPRAPFNRL